MEGDQQAATACKKRCLQEVVKPGTSVIMCTHGYKRSCKAPSYATLAVKTRVTHASKSGFQVRPGRVRFKAHACWLGIAIAMSP